MCKLYGNVSNHFETEIDCAEENEERLNRMISYYETGIPISEDSLARLRMIPPSVCLRKEKHLQKGISSESSSVIDGVRFCVVDELIEHRSSSSSLSPCQGIAFGKKPKYRKWQRNPKGKSIIRSRRTSSTNSKQPTSTSIAQRQAKPIKVMDESSVDNEAIQTAVKDDEHISETIKSQQISHESQSNESNNNNTEKEGKDEASAENNSCCRHCLLTRNPELMSNIFNELDCIKQLIHQNNSIIASANSKLMTFKQPTIKNSPSINTDDQANDRQIFFGYPLCSKLSSSGMHSMFRSFSLDDLSIGEMFLSKSIDGPRIVNVQLMKSYNGIGAYLATNAASEFGHFILRIEPGSPSHRCGLKEGDFIIEINGRNVEKLRFFDMIELLKRQCHSSEKIEFLVISYQGYIQFKKLNASTDKRCFSEGFKFRYLQFNSLRKKHKNRSPVTPDFLMSNHRSKKKQRNEQNCLYGRRHSRDGIFSVDDCFINLHSCNKMTSFANRSLHYRGVGSNNDMYRNYPCHAVIHYRAPVKFSTYISNGTMI